MLSILDKEVIRDVKVAAAQDERKVSQVVEEALRAWLAQRGRKQP
jgi:hypothetical protein